MSLPSLSKQIHDALSGGNTQQASELVRQATLAMLPLSLFDPVPKASAENMTAARDILEMAALLAVREGNANAFARRLAQLGPFTHLAPSKFSCVVTGLQLLFFLTRSEIASFHTKLESLAGDKLLDLSDPHLQFPIKLEQWLMEGSYSKVWQARENPPTPEFKVLLDHLVDTIRNEISACAERSYTSLPFSEAQSILVFQNPQELIAFASSRPNWHIDQSNSTINFSPQLNGPVDDDKELPKDTIVTKSLAYARELESIV